MLAFAGRGAESLRLLAGSRSALFALRPLSAQTVRPVLGVQARPVLGVQAVRPLHALALRPVPPAAARHHPHSRVHLFPRAFSGDAVSDSSDDDKEDEKKKRLRQYNYATVAMGAGAVATVSYGMHRLISTFMHIDFTTVAWVGFGTGFLSAALSAGGAFTLHRWLEIRPQYVYRDVMNTIRDSALVESTFGSRVSSGELRAYRVDGGHMAVNDSMRPEWKSPRCQMIFQLIGSNGTEALVTVEAVKERGKRNVTLLCIDVMNEDEDVLFLEGREERMHVKEQLRGFVDFKEKHCKLSRDTPTGAQMMGR